MLKINDKGFTLIELLVSIAIIGIIGVPLLGLFTASMRNNINARSKTETVTVAQSAMEWFKSYGQDSDDATVPAVKKLEDIITTIEENAVKNTSATLCIFYKENTELSQSLLNYDEGSGTEEFNDMKIKAESTGKDYDYMIKVVLTVMEEHDVIKIDITVWDKLFGDKSKVNLVSLRSDW